MEKNYIKLSNVGNGKTFFVGEVEFIKFYDEDGATVAVTKDCICEMEFGSNNDFSSSEILKKLQEDFLPDIAAAVGIENICDIETDLTTLDGLKPYENLVSKVTLPTFDFYRKNVEVFDKYKLDRWWWLATPETAQPHYNPVWITGVSPVGNVNCNYYSNVSGVRPFLRFVSSISVSCEE